MTGRSPATGLGRVSSSVTAAKNADESKVAFADAPGQAAIGVLRKFVDAGKRGDIRPEVMFQDFFAGRLGISMQLTAQLERYNREIGGRFALKCARYPRSAAPARLPAGGNVAMIFAKDPAKQEAAWKFVKFACGPEGGTMMVKATGYMPASAIPATRQDMLKGFYQQNPNHLAGMPSPDRTRSRSPIHKRSPANRRQQVEGADRRPCADGKRRGRLVAAGGSSLRPPASPSPHAHPAARLQPCRRPS